MSKRVSVVLAALAVLGLAVSASQAALIKFDVRAVSSGTTGATVNNTKDVTVTGATGALQLQLWAMITDADNNNGNEGFNQSMQSFVSYAGSPGNLLGTLAATQVAPFDGVVQPGRSTADLDGDGDTDVGNLATSGANQLDFFYPTAGGTTKLWAAVTNEANKADENVAGVNYSSFLIGTMTFAWNGVNMAQNLSTNINAVPRTKTDGLAASKLIHQFTANGTASSLAGTAVDLGTAVHVALPEPATLSVLAVGGLLALRRRRA